MNEAKLTVEDTHNSTTYFNEKGNIHRVGNWAKYTKTGFYQFLHQWKIDGKHHRENGPAWHYSDGQFKHVEVWYINDLVHRIGGPAKTESNNIRSWMRIGNWHRLNAPAVIAPHKKEWWEFGIKLNATQNY